MCAVSVVTVPPSSAAIPPDALSTLAQWLPANCDPDRPLIALATVDPKGWPDVRSVLLSEYTATGFFVHTDSLSRKVADVIATPRAAFSIAWPTDLRQLTVQATVERATPDEEATSFARRSRYLQLLAWQNSLTLAQLPQPQRETEWAAFEAAHPEGSLDPPPEWYGLCLKPTRLTFWRGGTASPGLRTEYTVAADGDWQVSLLAG